VISRFGSLSGRLSPVHAGYPDTTISVRSDVDVGDFGSKLYQWASTLTFTGRNMPFALPFRTNPLETGFEVWSLPLLEPAAPLQHIDVLSFDADGNFTARSCHY
jgi:hypothetical protein